MGNTQGPILLCNVDLNWQSNFWFTSIQELVAVDPNEQNIYSNLLMPFK